MANEYSRLYAISDDLCAVPLVIAEGGSVEELCEQLGYWQYDYATPETLALVRAVLATAKPPSDGLLGCVVSERFTLPGGEGLRVHLQCCE